MSILIDYDKRGEEDMPVPGDSALAIFLPQDVAQVVDTWRRRYDPHVDSIAPHITMAYPPFVPEPEWSVVRPQLAECLAGIEPIDVTLRTVGIFAGSPSVLWLRPEDDGKLAHIHASLAECFPKYLPPSPFEYVPHVTIGFFDSSDALAQAQTVVLQELNPMRFQVREFMLGVYSPLDEWQLHDRVSLGTAISESHVS
jgi:2'-5' RNA ligase